GNAKGANPLLQVGYKTQAGTKRKISGVPQSRLTNLLHRSCSTHFSFVGLAERRKLLLNFAQLLKHGQFFGDRPFCFGFASCLSASIKLAYVWVRLHFRNFRLYSNHFSWSPCRAMISSNRS